MSRSLRLEPNGESAPLEGIRSQFDPSPGTAESETPEAGFGKLEAQIAARRIEGPVDGFGTHETTVR